MVIIKIADGLGNQLFNYACGYSVAKMNDETLRLDTSDCDNSRLRDYELGNFKLDAHQRESFSNRSIWKKIYKRLRRDILYSVVSEKEPYVLDRRVFKSTIRNKYLDGYWQNHHYFEHYKKDIIRQIQPDYDQSDQIKMLIKKFQDSNTCAIHIRTGDITPLPLTYFQNAIKWMDTHIKEIQYIVFSNDGFFAKRYLEEISAKDIKMIDSFGEYTDIDQFFLLSACQNQIISQSTFSWWGAYINPYENKMVIAPDKGEYTSEYYPEGWKILKV